MKLFYAKVVDNQPILAVLDVTLLEGCYRINSTKKIAGDLPKLYRLQPVRSRYLFETQDEAREYLAAELLKIVNILTSRLIEAQNTLRRFTN